MSVQEDIKVDIMSGQMDISAILQAQNPWWGNPNHRETRSILARRPAFSKLIEYAGNGHEGRALLIIGPRQVGKTTLLLQLADQLLDNSWPPGNLTFFDFADERLVETISPRDVLSARPPGLSLDYPRLLLLDEVQYAAGWARWLKGAVDQARRGGSPIRFIVTGSAAASLRSGAVESGQGRWDEVPLEGLTFSEFLTLGSASNDEPARLAAREPQAFDRYLALGGLPEHIRSQSPRETRQRIRDDIAERAIMRDLRGAGVEVERVRRLFVHLVTGSGHELNQSDRANDLDANRKSLTDWLSLLESTHLLVRLERDRASLKKAKAQLRSRPKIFATDHGLIAAFSPHPEPLEVSDVLARVYEAVVFRHLREVARESGAELTFFRLNDDLEVDFVVRHAATTVGVEVTSSPNARPHKLARADQAMRKAGIERKLLLHGGLTMTRTPDLDIVPVHEFLLAPGKYAGSEP